MREDLVLAGRGWWAVGWRYKIYNSILTILVNTVRGSTATETPWYFIIGNSCM